MFDKKMYMENCSLLHASQDTLTEVWKAASGRTQKAARLPRPAAALSLLLILLFSSAALAAGSRVLYGGLSAWLKPGFASPLLPAAAGPKAKTLFLFLTHRI